MDVSGETEEVKAALAHLDRLMKSPMGGRASIEDVKALVLVVQLQARRIDQLTEQVNAADLQREELLKRMSAVELGAVYGEDEE